MSDDGKLLRVAEQARQAVEAASKKAAEAAAAITLEGLGGLPASSYTAADVLAKIKTVDGPMSLLDADTLDGFHKAQLSTLTGYHFANGFLIATDIAHDTNTMFALVITGNGYSVAKNIRIELQGYNYAAGNTIMNLRALAYDLSFNIDIFIYNNLVHFWFAQPSSYQTYTVSCRTQENPDINRVTSITNAAKPSTGVTHSATVTPTQAWNSGNDGTGSGLDADKLDSREATEFVLAANLNKLLWSGSWTTGNITVSGFSGYSLFVVCTASAAMVGYKWGSSLNVVQEFAQSSLTYLGGYAGSFTFSGDVLTYVNVVRIQHTFSNTHNAGAQTTAVTAIYGVF